MGILQLARRFKHEMFLVGRSAGQIKVGLQSAFDVEQRRIDRLVKAGMRLPPLPTSRSGKGSVWAVSVMKNEADVVRDTVEHLLRQGVDGVLVADNGSTDGTLEILRQLALKLPVHLAYDDEPAHFHDAKMNHLARWARRAGAEWIVPFDADELWFAASETLADGLRACPSPIAVAAVHNVFPDPDGGWRADSSAAQLQKVAFRTHPLARVHYGNHAVTRPGQPISWLKIAHYPWRSFNQFHAKIRKGASAINQTGRVYQPSTGGDHWQVLDQLSDSDLLEIWEELLLGRGSDEILLWAPRGVLVPADPLRWKYWDADRLLSESGS